MFPVKYGKYELLERIARGGMAEIYKARITGEAGFQKLLALKKLHAHLSENHEMVNMLKDEANIVSNMMHPNICQVYDLGKVEDTYYIAMEYIHGKDLSTIIRKERKRKRKIPLDIGLFIIRQVLTGLDYAHRMVDPTTGNQLNIVHRDISPQNIIVSYSGGIKVIDFGIAKATQGLHHTQDGVIKGKFRYMAPEQAMGKNLDHRVDIFATGVVLYEMLMGESHSRGASDAQLIIKAQTANFEPIDNLIKGLPKGLGLAVMKSMAKNIDNRFPSARTFRNALDRIVKREGLEVAPDVVSSYLTSLFPNPFSKGSRVDEIEQLSGSDFIEVNSEIPDATGYFKGQKHPDPPPPMDLDNNNSSLPLKSPDGFSQPVPDYQNAVEDIPPPDPVDLSKIEAKPLGLTKATSEKGRERRRRERLKKKKQK
ncbi:MAG: serine/threonine protein kinase, partial [Myxococcota bacterium]